MQKEQCKSLITADFDLFEIDELYGTKIGSAYPNHEFADCDLYEYEFPKKISITYNLCVYILFGSICYDIEIPDQNITISYTRKNVETSEEKYLEAIHFIKDFKIIVNEISETKTHTNKFYNEIVLSHVELHKKIVYIGNEN